MLNTLKQEWRRVKDTPPGRRFQHTHNRARHHGISAGWGRLLCFVLALVCAAIGVVLVFIPGPAFVFFILTAALLACQWRWMACWLDRTELALLKRWRRFREKRRGRARS